MAYVILEWPLERIAQLGSGAKAAGERRRAVQRLEEVRSRQAEAYQMASRNRSHLVCISEALICILQKLEDKSS